MPMLKSKINLNIRHMAMVIANTVDLVGVDDTSHGKRVGIIARECAKARGFGPQAQELAFQAGLLHDCGVSSTRVHHKLISELDWGGTLPHCERGSQLLRQFQPLSHLAPIVLYHHTHWNDLPADLSAETASYASLIYLADRADMLAQTQKTPNPTEVCGRIAHYAGDFFAPEWVEAFLTASAEAGFWSRLAPENIAAQVQASTGPADEGWVDMRQLHAFALIIARIVDAKSPFTAEHSLGVASLAKFLGEVAGLPRDKTDKLEIAGLLHDIGKLRIPDEILEKPAKLDATERVVMNSHSLGTWQILEPIEGIEEIAQWAAFHHESLNGTGYPFQLHNGQLSIEARIIRVADVYQAMAQKRPYRDTTRPAEILALLRQMVAQGEIDGLVVDWVEANLERCHSIALGLSAP